MLIAICSIYCGCILLTELRERIANFWWRYKLPGHKPRTKKSTR